MPLNKNTVPITFAPEQVTNIHINQVNIMKKTILAMTLSAVLSGCNFDNNESASTSDFPVSTIEVTLEKHATLVPIRSGENAEFPAYKDVFHNGPYMLCWKDSMHLADYKDGQCEVLPELDSQEESYPLTVYGDATISVQSAASLEGYPEFSDSIHISGKMEYKYGDSLTPILPIKNEHYAAVDVLSHSGTFPIETAVFGWAEDHHNTLNAIGEVENYEVRRIYFTPTNSKYGLEVKLQHNDERPLTAELEAPQVGKSYRYEIQESFDSATGITITPTIEDLDSVDQCLGSDCDKPEPTIPEESLSGANIIVEVDGTINATIKEDGTRSEIKTTVESSAPLEDLVLDFNIETELSGSYYALTLVDVKGDFGESNGLVYVKYATNVELYSSPDDQEPSATFNNYDAFVEDHGSMRFAQVEDVKAVKPNLIWVSHSDDSEAKAGDSFEVKSFKVLEKVQPILPENQFAGVTTTVNDDGSVTATVKENALSKNAAGKAFIKVDGTLTLNDYDLTFDIDNPKSDLDMGQRHFVNVYLEDSIRADILLQKDPVEVVISDRPNHLSMEDFLSEFGNYKVITWHDGINFNVNFVYRSNGSAINGAGDTFTVRKYATKKNEEI